MWWWLPAACAAAAAGETPTAQIPPGAVPVTPAMGSCSPPCPSGAENKGRIAALSGGKAGPAFGCLCGAEPCFDQVKLWALSLLADSCNPRNRCFWIKSEFQQSRIERFGESSHVLVVTHSAATQQVRSWSPFQPWIFHGSLVLMAPGTKTCSSCPQWPNCTGSADPLLSFPDHQNFPVIWDLLG